MYSYNGADTRIVTERAAQFRDQVERRLDGRLSEAQFRPLRLMNGLYYQRHAYMLRVAVPYGTLSSRQLRRLGHVARTFDKGYGHFTTRQNIQFNWLALDQVPDVLDQLAEVEMHAIQTSGNCVRNISCDHLAGVARDEVEDPRPYCEIMRQWSSFHPEFAYLPRKFKLAFTAAKVDRAAIRFHDIGYHLKRNDSGETGFEVFVGGGLGRSPFIGMQLHPFLPAQDLLAYTESILRIYNLQGDREKKYRARIKYTVRDMGFEVFKAAVEADFQATRCPQLLLTPERIASMARHFEGPAYDPEAVCYEQILTERTAQSAAFAAWRAHNTIAHKVPGYHVVVVSLKAPDVAPGDITALQLEALADLADQYSFGELRSLHTQNLLLPDVCSADLFPLWKSLQLLKLATPNIDTLTDQIVCPGLDFCALANSETLSVAQELNDAFDDLDALHDLGELKLKMSGCINACGHHHIGHIGILGIDRRGQQFYQIMLGGSEGVDASLGKWLGRAFPKTKIVAAVQAIVAVYVAHRRPAERLLDTTRRIGFEPFKARVYPND